MNRRELWRHYKRHLPAAALAGGFVWDLSTLGRPDRLFDNAVLLSYLTIAAGGIAIIAWREGRAAAPSLFLLGLVQFAFGNLASGLLVIYGKSGTLAGGALLLLPLAAFLIGNEFLRGRYAQLRFNLIVWQFFLLLYLTIIVPVLLGQINTLVFFGGVLAATALDLLLIWTLFLLAAPLLWARWRHLALIALLVGGGFSALYFLNVLPPVPLALKEIGIYHRLTRTPDGNYRAWGETPHWYELFRDTSAVYRRTATEGATCFSAVFAPAGLSTPVYHRWEYFDEAKRRWTTATRVASPIAGGRETGYRTYSLKSALAPGRWRCNVETARGALIGRLNFYVVSADSPPALVERAL